MWWFRGYGTMRREEDFFLRKDDMPGPFRRWGLPRVTI